MRYTIYVIFTSMLYCGNAIFVAQFDDSMQAGPKQMFWKCVQLDKHTDVHSDR